MDPLVSVIVPVYNVYPYLHEAIDSVINQTYTNLEIILIDDGSTDGSGEICDEYAERDSRIRVIHQDNKGLSTARNIGLENSSGKLIAFMDPDDAYDTTFFEKTVSAFTSEKVDMVVCMYTNHTTTKQIVKRDSDKPVPSIEPGIYERTEVIQALIDGKICEGVWNKLYGRDIWENVRFHDGHVYEDNEVAFRICRICKNICVIPDALYLHRKRPGSITAVHTKNNTDDAILACVRTESFIRENTPSVFSDEQLIQFERRQINRLIAFYVRSRKVIFDNKREKNEYREGLRQQIIDRGSKYGVKGLTFRAGIAYRMLRNCPFLLDFIYPLYGVMHKAVFKLTGR